MANIDAIRSKARRAAWTTDDGTPNYNPFARTRSRETTPNSDVENQFPPNNNRTRSDNNVPRTIEEERRLESRHAEHEFPSPTHADTAPPTSATSEKAPNNLHDAPQSPDREPTSIGKESAGTSDTAVAESHHGVRERLRFKNILRKNTEKDENELEHVNTDKSSKSERQKAAFKRKIPIGQQFKAILFGSWINILLVAVPVGIIVNYLHINGIAVFVINFIAIIPLAAMLSYATEELAMRVGETLGGLLNASFGNAVELIVSIQALVKNEITIVKTSLIGSMLSNLLLVLGMCFFFGGLSRLEQFFNVTVAQTAASLLALCIGSLIIPTVFHTMVSDDLPNDNPLEPQPVDQELSRGTAVILLIVYACYLVFQLKSHVDMYNEPSQKVAKRKSSKVVEGNAIRGLASAGAGTAAVAGGQVNSQQLVRDADQEAEEDEIEEPQLSIIGALVTLAISTALVGICSEFMVDNIDPITEAGVTRTFVGLILLPIVGNAAEHATAVTVAIKDKMDLAIGVAVGSSMQIALLVLPFVVVIGWIISNDCMSLYFDTFQIAVLFVAVLLVNYLIQDGKSHWLEGVLLMASYLIIAVAAWFYPNPSQTSTKCPK